MSSVGHDLMLALKRWGAVFSLLATPIALASYLGEVAYFFDLIANFKFQIAIMLFFVVFFNALFFNKWSFIWNSILLGAILIEITPWYIKPHYEGDPKRELSVYVANVFTGNTEHQLLKQQLLQLEPDVVALLEVNQRWLDAMNDVKGYKYKKLMPREDNFGIAIYSKVKLENVELKYFGSARVPSIVGVLKQEDGEGINVIVSHPFPPTSKRNAQLRDEGLDSMGQYVKDLSSPKVVVGDLNVTMWSPSYKNLEETAGLINTRKGFGIGGTWPDFSFTHIPLDHCLVSSSIHVREFKVLDGIGSDHFPIYVELSY